MIVCFALTLLGGRDHEDHYENNCECLNGDAPTHHFVAVFTVEFTAFGHSDEAKDQGADNGNHCDQQKDEKSIHNQIISPD